MAASEWISNVSEADFTQQVIERSQKKPVVVDFWAPWCGPCRALTPILERAINARQGEILLAKLNVDEAPNLAQQFAVESIPLVLAFRQGQPVADFLGVIGEGQLQQFLDSLMPSEAERQLQQAVALEKTDPIQAEQLYRQALAALPNQEAVSIGLARVLLHQNRDAEAEQILKDVAATGELGLEMERLRSLLYFKRLAPQGGDEATLRQRLTSEPKNAQVYYELGCVLAAKGQYQEALDMLLAAGERNAQLATKQVRETMVQIFNTIGPQSPLANEYRQRLSELLY